MTKAQEHKLVIWALLAVAVAIIIYLLFDQNASTPAATGSSVLQPGDYGPGVASVPDASIVPGNPNGIPAPITFIVPPVNLPYSMAGGDCSCGCGNSVTIPALANQNTLFDELQSQANAALAASDAAILSSFGYQMGVAVNNNTPLGFPATG